MSFSFDSTVTSDYKMNTFQQPHHHQFQNQHPPTSHSQPQPHQYVQHIYNDRNTSQGLIYSGSSLPEQMLGSASAIPQHHQHPENYPRSNQAPVNDEAFFDLLAQGPSEQLQIAGLHEDELEQPVSNSQSNAPIESVDLESLLEDDPLLSFTTTLDRQESNDTILQSSSPIMDSIEPLKPIVEVYQLSGNQSQASLINHQSPQDQISSQRQSFIPTPASSIGPAIQSPVPYQQSIQATFVNYSHSNMSNETVVHPSMNNRLNVASPQIDPELQQVPVPPHLKLQIQNQALFQNHQMHQLQQQEQQQIQQQIQQQHVQQLAQQQLQQHHIQHQQNHSQAQLQQQLRSQQQLQQQQQHHHIQEQQQKQFQHQFQGQPQFYQYQSLQNIAHPPSVPPPPHPRGSLPTVPKPPLTEQQKFKNNITQPKQSKVTIKDQLPPTPPASIKPSLNKSSSTTKLNKTKKFSSSTGTPKMILKKSQSFLSSTANTKNTPFFSTLDFSKSVNATFVNKDPNFSKMAPASRPTLRVTNSFKNYEFVFEKGSQSGRKSSTSGGTPRRKSSTALSTPTSAQFSHFAKPPVIDFSFSNSPSASPTESEISGHSPLTGFSGQTPVLSSISRFSPLDQSSSPIFDSNAESSIRKKKNSTSGVSPPTRGSPNTDMKAGMIEFRLSK